MEEKIIWRDYKPRELEKKYLEKKLSKLRKILENLKGKREIWLEVKKSTHHQKGFFETEIRILLKRRPLRVLGSGINFMSSLDEAINEILRELRKYKEKTIDIKRRKARAFKKLLRGEST